MVLRQQWILNVDYSHVSRQFPSPAFGINCYPFEANYVEHITALSTFLYRPSTQPPRPSQPPPRPSPPALCPIPKSGAAIALER